MKSKLFLTIFYLAAAMWGLAVFNAASRSGSAKAYGLAFVGAAVISVVGLRLHHIIRLKNILRKRPLVPVSVVWNEPSAPFEQGHCASYVDRKVRVRKAAAAGR